MIVMNEDYITKRFGYFIPKKDKDLRKILENSNWNFQLQLIRDLQQENKQLKERIERIDNYLDKNYTMENQYWFDYIRDIIKDR